MQLVEQHVIDRNDPRYTVIDAAAFASKNLYNAALYLVRQSFIFQGVYLNNTAVLHLIKDHEADQALPRKVSNQVLLQLHKAWIGFFDAMDEWREHPDATMIRTVLGSITLPSPDEFERGKRESYQFFCAYDFTATKSP